MPAPALHVLTGGPGSGKSTLIRALGGAGYRCFGEAGRAIMRFQDAIGGQAHPARDPDAYAEAMLGWDLRSHAEASETDGPVFFDRGIADTIGYLNLIGHTPPHHLLRAAALFRYANPILVAPPWPQIYENDGERHQDLAEAVATCDAIRAVYAGLGYQMVELPRVDPAARLRFVIAAIDASR